MSFKICSEFFATLVPPGGDFHFFQNDLPCQLYNFGPSDSDFSLLISIKSTIAKIHHLISLRFEQSELKKSQCVFGSQSTVPPLHSYLESSII